MKYTVLFAASLLLLSYGCGTAPHRFDPSGNQGLTTTDDINYKDYEIAAQKAINSLLSSGTLRRSDGKRTVLMISQVKNSTLQHINTRELTKKIRVAVLRSGQAVTTTAVSANGPEDKASRQVRELKDDPMFKQSTVKKDGTAIAPDMSLSGEIIQQKTKQGRMRESIFIFQLSLTDLETGLAVWEDEIPVGKQSKKPLFGY